MIKRKLTIATAAAMFFVLAGTGVASALWSTPATVGSKVQVATLADDCDPATVRSMVNASFETPVIASGVGYASGSAAVRNGDQPMDGWRARTNSGAVTRIEIWVSGTTYDNLPAVIAPVGRQFVELNADEPGTLYQQLTTVPGQTMQWSFLHRGRMTADTMELLIGAPGATVSQNTFTDSYQSVNGNNGWVRYSGAYVVPAGQTTTELGFRSLNSGSLGNFLDDVSFGSGPCVTATSTASKTTASVGDTVTYRTTVRNSGSSPAVATAFTWAVPSGLTYKANTLRVNDVVAGSVSGATITAPLGASGSLAQGSDSVVSFDVTVTNAAAATYRYEPVVTYSNGLATGWTRSVTAANVNVNVVVDTTKPSIPGTPTATGTTASQTTLTWAASTDNIAVTAYDIYRNGNIVGSTTSPTVTYTSTGLVAWSSNVYTIRARDAAGNVSDASGSRTVVASPSGLNTTSSFKISRTPANEEFCVTGASGNTTLTMSTTCTGNILRNWSFVPSTDGYAKISMATSPVRYWTASNGTALSASGITNTANQDWLVEVSGDGYTFESRSRPGMCIERTTTTAVTLMSCNPNSAPQTFDATVRP